MRVWVLDIGNTRLKLGVFKDDALVDSRVFTNSDAFLAYLESENRGEKIVIGSVGTNALDMESILNRDQIIWAKTSWNIPITTEYQTMDTLGIDRLAAICGAHARYPGACLVFDAGTCLTVDVLDEAGMYKGGSIAPGWNMRLKAMANQTDRLPLVERKGRDEVLGTTTATALQGGGFWGYIFEIQSYVRHFKNLFKDINVLITGGDAYELAKYLKLEIFVAPNLVLYGLNEMYKTHYA